MFPPLTFSAQNRRDYCKRRWNITIRNSDVGQYWNPKASKAVTNLLFVDSVKLSSHDLTKKLNLFKLLMIDF
jgi:hypothetical protein